MAATGITADRAADEAPATLRAACATAGEGLFLPGWSADDWRRLLDHAAVRTVPTGEALIRRAAADRTLYVVVAGQLEVMAHAGDGMSMGRLARVGPGGVVGEQAFFDGAPRNAGAWAVGACTVAALTPERFADFTVAEPRQAADLLFALGRVLAQRLRRTTAGTFG